MYMAAIFVVNYLKSLLFKCFLVNMVEKVQLSKCFLMFRFFKTNKT